MIDNKVIKLPVITTLNLNPNDVLEAALEQNLDSVVILGYGQACALYFASSIASGPEVLWLLEKAKLELLNTGEE